jgi:hypothetical protein
MELAAGYRSLWEVIGPLIPYFFFETQNPQKKGIFEKKKNRASGLRSCWNEKSTSGNPVEVYGPFWNLMDFFYSSSSGFQRKANVEIGFCAIGNENESYVTFYS